MLYDPVMNDFGMDQTMRQHRANAAEHFADCRVLRPMEQESQEPEFELGLKSIVPFLQAWALSAAFVVALVAVLHLVYGGR